MSLRTGAISREMETLLKKNMDAIGIRMHFRLAPFQDIIKEVHAGNFQLTPAATVVCRRAMPSWCSCTANRRRR